MSRPKISKDYKDGYDLGYKKGYVEGAKDFQPKKGKWITHSDYPDRLICSNCNHKYDVWFIDNGTNFCPNCGADMVADLCSICKHGDNCERSDKGISFANHSVCWKFER